MIKLSATKKTKAFTLLELLVCVSIVGVFSLIAIPGLLSQIKDFQVKEDIIAVQQAIKDARNNAIEKSVIYYVDFSKSKAAYGNKGGLIEVKKADGTVISQVSLGRNVLYNAGGSSINSDIIYFNYRGEPSDSAGNTSSFNSTNNKITISYYKKNTSIASKSITISPITGNIKLN